MSKYIFTAIDMRRNHPAAGNAGGLLLLDSKLG